MPQTLINAIRSNEKIQDLTVVSNNAGNSGNGGLCESPSFRAFALSSSYEMAIAVRSKAEMIEGKKADLQHYYPRPHSSASEIRSDINDDPLLRRYEQVPARSLPRR